jgi:hypothetical protein
MAGSIKGNGRPYLGRPSVQPAVFSRPVVLRQQGGRLLQESLFDSTQGQIK